MGTELMDRRIVLAALAVAVGSSRAYAQAPVRASEVLYVESIQARTFETLRRLRAYAGRTRGEAGALSSVLLQEVGRPERLAVYSVFESEAALAAHLAGASRKGLDVEVAGSTQAPVDDRLGTVISASPWRAGRGSLYVLSHVDVAPPGAADAAAALKAQAEAAASVAGCQGFEVSVQTGRTNHFAVAHAWRDRLSFGDYAARDQARRTRAALAVNKGALYDERVYRVEG